MRSVRKDSRSGLKERYKCAGREEHRPYVHLPAQFAFLDGARCRITTGLIFHHIHQNLDRDKRSNKRLPERGLFLMSKRRNAINLQRIMKFSVLVRDIKVWEWTWIIQYE